VYASANLRPSFDEAHARVLAGEAPAADAPSSLTDLAQTRAAIRGDDAPSRKLLSAIANDLRVRGIVVVMAAPELQARVFLADAAAFDAARYVPDVRRDASDAGTEAPPSSKDWSGAIASLERAFAPSASTAPEPTATPAPRQALEPTPARREGETGSHPFYTSPWFWGAVGAAVFGGTALYFATRDNGSSTIHLQLQVPK
jgi:hypothetical protein